MRHFITLTLLVFFVSSFFSTIKADILHVKPGAASTVWQGKSNVYDNLQTAMDEAVSGDEIWVAAGTYKPTNDGNRNISFQLKDGVKYYGGFSGDETELAKRDWNTNKTILSGDIGVEGNNTDNSYHVLMAKGTEDSPITDKTRLDGFIIEEGYANEWSSENRDGGGLYLKFASPVILNCHFKNNCASDYGGAVYGEDYSDAMFGNVIFSDNSSGDYGGAVYSYGTEMKFYNCVWYGNHSGYQGGAIYGSSPNVYNSIAWNNTAPGGGDDFYLTKVSYSIYKNGSSDNDNISADPQFVDVENGDFRVRKESPAVNAGNSEDVPDWLQYDFSGNARVQNDTIDIGALEGGVLTPDLKSPANYSFLESTVTEVLLEWEWKEEEPENITGYELEYIIDDDDTTVVKDVQQMNYTLTGLTSTQKIQWRVRGINGSGTKNWSSRNEFYISRGHPIYVKPGASGDGSSWSNAMGLKEALDVSVFGDSLWVAGGTYKPTNDGDRDISFELNDGVKVYGGFSGDETKLGQRDWQQNETILSGDIGEEGDETDNSYHVLMANGTETSPITDKTRLDGFIIEEGYADEGFSENRDGGGLYLTYASPVIKNTRFRKNHAERYGGAVYGNDFSEGLFGNVIFSDNSAGDYGGAVYSNGPEMKFYNCVWYGNHSGFGGGAIYGFSVKVYNSIAWNNTASGGGNDFYLTKVSYSIYKNGSSDNDNISADPQFVDPENGDFRVRKVSPAINGGNSEDVPDWLQYDFSGNARGQNDTIDIGAFEGGVLTPDLKSPANDSVLESTVTEVLLEWEWKEEEPENITGYELEYIIDDDDTPVVKDVQQMNYTLTGLTSKQKIQWRVRGINGSGTKNWSSRNEFYISRGHPIYVKPGASGDGSSWSNAMGLKEALDVSVFGDSLWVAGGTYKPTNDGDRSIRFELKDGVKVYGGFSGDETKLGQRDWQQNETILSGDIGEVGDNTDNSNHVLMAKGTVSSPITEKTRLDGFIIEKGWAPNEGGGLYLRHSSPVIKNTRFRKNHAERYGGAVYGEYYSDAMFGNVIFSDNGAGHSGGAVYSNGPEMKFYNCVWYGNHSGSWGGAIRGSSAKVYNSIAWNNTANHGNDDFAESDVFYTLYKGGSLDNNNISADPLFIDPENGDFRVQKVSSAINAGNSEDVPDWLHYDFSGNARVQNDTIDIGAFEGGVLTPDLKSPANYSVLESTVTEVLLEWEWKEEEPENITGYELEYIIDDDDTPVVKDVQQMNYTLTGLTSKQKIQWRVRGINGSGTKNWSSHNEFYISRGHPIYVKPGASGDGSSWSNAMGLKEALDVSVFGDSLWVAGGTYKPTNDGDRSIRFELKDGVKVYGGFSGDETQLSQRDWQQNETILSGDIGEEGDETDNSNQVLMAKGTVSSPITEKTRLDGFIIEKGWAPNDGGGLYLRHSSPVIKNTRFRKNHAERWGGAVYGEYYSDAMFGNVIFSDNSAGNYGGAVFSNGPEMKFYNCVWYGNHSGSWGGAIRGSSAKVYNSIAWNNTANHGNDDFAESDVFYTLYKGGSLDNNNISSDPHFVDPENGNFFLQSGSPAINAGSNEHVSENIRQDYAGFDRVFGDSVDIGAFEFRRPHHLSPGSGMSVTKDYSTLDMVNFSWGITDLVSDTTQNFPDDYKWRIKIWKNGDEDNPVRDEEISTGNLMGESNNTVLGGFDFGSKYHWQIGLNMGNYISWSTPTSFYIGHDHVIHVKEGSTGTTGEDWSSAFGTLHEALDYSIPGDEIWVAKGTYYPVTPADPAQITQDEREQFLSLKPGMALYGGFAGDEISVSQRNNQENETIISGDIGVEGESSDNSIHLFHNEFDASEPLERGAIIDAFVLEEATGSAVANKNASPSMNFCVFRNNRGENGGAVYNENSSPFFYNTLFHSNQATSNGGAIYADDTSMPELLNCTVADNSTAAGGALSGDYKIRNSIVFGNEGGQPGASSDVAYSCIEDGFEGNENISDDPIWEKDATLDYQLSGFSPCINQGNKALLPPDIVVYDLAYKPRLHSSHVDMGAYEAQSVGKLEIVESPLINGDEVDFIDSIIIRFNQPIAVDTAVSTVFNPNVDFELKRSQEDSTILFISHHGLKPSSGYHLELPGGQVTHFNNDRITASRKEYDFTTRECVPVTLTPRQSTVSACLRGPAQLGFDIEGDLLEHTLVFNDRDTLDYVDTLKIESVFPEDLGEYKLIATGWCEDTVTSSLDLQFKEMSDLVIPEPKWNSVYFVDNGPGNFSGFKWYANEEVVSEKQYLDVGAEKGNKFVVAALDKASGCVVYSDTIRYSGEGLKSANITPNPVQSGNPVSIQLPEVSGNSEIRLYDMAGNLLERKFFDKGDRLRLENTRFQTGVYLLRLEYSDGRVEERKLIID